MPIKIIETEKEGHRKVKTQEPKRYRGLKSDLYGTKTHKKKPGRTNFRRGGKGTGPTPGERIKARKARAEE